MKRLLRSIVNRIPPRVIKRIAAWQFSSPFAAQIIRWGSRVIRNQDGVIRYGQGADLKFNTGNANPGYALGTTEPLVQDVLGCILRPGDVFFDIGANVGFYTVIGARLVGPMGRVFAFEPFPENAAAARHNAELNAFHTITVLEDAVSDVSGEGELLLAAEPTWAKLDFTGSHSSTHGRLKVNLVRIDDLIEQKVVEPPALVKIDVEGAEVEVLRGMAGTVAAFSPLILCENHGRNEQVAGLLNGFGYWQVVLENPGKDLRESPWDVHVLAGPPSREELLRKVSLRLAHSD